MINGSVAGLQPQVEVVFRLLHRSDLVIQFVIDTGFQGALALAPDAIAAMGLPFYEEITASLADGSYVKVDVHSATILWDGREIQVAVLATGRRPLLGTALLDGYNFNADFVDGGPLSLTRL